MPVRSLHSSVVKWPSKEEVLKALTAWAEEEMKRHPEIIKIGLFGSYARGDYGVGSDLDLLIVVREEKEPILRRALKYDTARLPLSAEVWVYLEEELETLKETRFYREVLEKEIIWIVESKAAKSKESS